MSLNQRQPEMGFSLLLTGITTSGKALPIVQPVQNLTLWREGWYGHSTDAMAFEAPGEVRLCC